jgi:histone deacetylase complex regulatory component SIN3
MKEYKARQTDVPGVVERVHRLFVGEMVLLEAFQMWIPPNHRLAPVDVSFKDAIGFIEAIEVGHEMQYEDLFIKLP